MGLERANDVTHRKRAGDLGEIWKSQLSWELETEQEGSTFEASRIYALRAPHEMGGGRWKSQNRKNVYLSSLCRNL